MQRFIVFYITLILSYISIVHGLSLQQRQLEWDEAVLTYYQTHQPPKLSYPFRLYMTLYHVQKEAFDSLNTDTLNPYVLDKLNLQICQLFLPDFSLPISEEESSLPPSVQEALYQRAVQFKIAREEDPLYRFRIQNFELFCVSPPPSLENKTFWDHQLKRLFCIRNHLSYEEGELSRSWKLLAGPGKNFVNLLMRYLECHEVNASCFFSVRAHLIGGMYDAFAVSGHYKYLYNIPRPHILDPVFEPLFSGPNSPSYPSGHASIAGVCNTLLNHYFPEARSLWTQNANELVMSRLWAGVHYPIDTQEGYIIGERVGKAYLTGKGLEANPFALEK
jgi:hypothetical protein